MHTALAKSALRKEFIARRNALSSHEKVLREEKALGHLRSILPSVPATIHLFLSAKGKSEFDTWPLSEELQSNGYLLCIPYITGKGTMVSATYYGKDSLISRSFGLFEPVDPHFTDPSSISFILVPLLAFDSEGYRLGYGGGYYDLYLKDFERIPKVGLSLFPAESKLLPREPWDIPLDAVACPDGLLKFGLYPSP